MEHLSGAGWLTDNNLEINSAEREGRIAKSDQHSHGSQAPKTISHQTEHSLVRPQPSLAQTLNQTREGESYSGFTHLESEHGWRNNPKWVTDASFYPHGS